MKRKYICMMSAAVSLMIPKIDYCQAPTLGTVANFVLFSSNGAVSNSGISQLTGNIGTNNGSSTAFGNINGVIQDQDAASAQCSADLLITYGQLNKATPTFFPGSSLGNHDTLIAGVYSISGAATLNSVLVLNGNANSVFIFQIQGSFSSSPSSKVKLINGALACNVYWKIEGLVSLASGTTMRGTIIANNAAINMSTGDTLEGRALSTTGAIGISGTLAYTPVGCGIAILSGPNEPVLGSASCYALFSSDGAVSNTGTTYVTGDIGSNNGSATGYNSLSVSGTIHTIPDNSTADCAKDLSIAYHTIDNLQYDIELLHPAQFGNNLVLTPHCYLLNAATVLTDSLYLNAEGNVDAVFVIQVNGAFSTSVYSKILLINGAQADHVYWKIEGAVSINNYSVFNGTIICNNGALGAINTGVILNGRALTTTGALTTAAVTVLGTSLPGDCATLGIPLQVNGGTNGVVSVYPNPFQSGTRLFVTKDLQINTVEMKIYNSLGAQVKVIELIGPTTTLETESLPTGVYFFRVVDSEQILQTGKIISLK